MEKENFKKYLQEERVNFSKKILEYAPHETEHTNSQIKIRVASEDILIAYDQMFAILFSPPGQSEKLEGIKEKYAKEKNYSSWEEYINDQPNWMVEKIMDEIVVRFSGKCHYPQSETELFNTKSNKQAFDIIMSLHDKPKVNGSETAEEIYDRLVGSCSQNQGYEKAIKERVVKAIKFASQFPKQAARIEQVGESKYLEGYSDGRNGLYNSDLENKIKELEMKLKQESVITELNDKIKKLEDDNEHLMGRVKFNHGEFRREKKEKELLQEELSKLKQESEWISVKKKMPPEDLDSGEVRTTQYVLVTDGEFEEVDFYFIDRKSWSKCWHKKITHWMFLPSKPTTL